MSGPVADGPLHLVNDNETGDRLLIYATEAGADVQLRVTEGTFWATQAQMAAMFGVDRRTINEHLSNIFNCGELDEAATCRKFRQVRLEGAREVTREIPLYNLNALISVGYRVGSKQGTLFRIWATDKLLRYLTKGFVIDAVRLKAPDEHDRVAELREIIRDIRASEANVYAELRRICAMCQDYDPKSPQSRRFYATMQAKLYWAVVSGTPSMVLADRADASEPNMGLQTWPKPEIRQADATNAKNYLAGAELRELNRLTTILLDIFDDQLEIGKLTLMSEADTLLEAQLANLNRVVLRNGGSVSHDTAEAHAKAEYAKFDSARRERRRLEAQEALAAVKSSAQHLPKPRRTRKKPDKD